MPSARGADRSLTSTRTWSASRSTRTRTVAFVCWTALVTSSLVTRAAAPTTSCPERLSVSRAATNRRAMRGLQLVAGRRISIPASSPRRLTGRTILAVRSRSDKPAVIRTNELTVEHLTVMRRRSVVARAVRSRRARRRGTDRWSWPHDPGPGRASTISSSCRPARARRSTPEVPSKILPRDLEVRVGDRIVVLNEDGRAHEVGPWTVPAGDTFAFRFKAVGRYDSHCSLHRGGGRFFIDVLPALV